MTPTYRTKRLGSVALAAALLTTACASDYSVEDTFSCEEGIYSEDPKDYTFELRILEGLQLNFDPAHADESHFEGLDRVRLAYQAGELRGNTGLPSEGTTLSGLGTNRKGTIYYPTPEDEKQAQVFARTSHQDLESGIKIELQNDYKHGLRTHHEVIMGCTLAIDAATLIEAHNSDTQVIEVAIDDSIETREGSIRLASEAVGCEWIEHGIFKITKAFSSDSPVKAETILARADSNGCGDLASSEVYNYSVTVGSASFNPLFLYEQGVNQGYEPHTTIELSYLEGDSDDGSNTAMKKSDDAPGADPYYDLSVGDESNKGLQINHLAPESEGEQELTLLGLPVRGFLGITIYQEVDGDRYTYANCILDLPESKILESVNGDSWISVYPKELTASGGLNCSFFGSTAEGFKREDGIGGMNLKFGARLKDSMTDDSGYLNPELI